MSTLIAFEAVARLGSVTEAAGELNLTQSAVSRQIQKLEDQLGSQLFERQRKRLFLTAHGARYVSEIRAALNQINNATMALRTNPDGGSVNLAILPSLGTHWLAPRLPDFFASNPGITLNMSTRIEPFDFAYESFHAALHYGRLAWPGTESMKLLDEQMVAVASPKLIQVNGMQDLPRLSLQTRAYAWEEWSKDNGWGDATQPAMVFDQFATMMRAAQSGLGVALMPDYLVDDEIARGTLVELPETLRVRMGAYLLVWPEGTGDYPALAALRRWLETQT
ncbi:LysR family transcriptional regulator [uncultured Shimia sp.]|uniref:LysR family transcriptional regulator n=1 Tax=uncultured Shimia sp. TaxID=573152 RepID=UPI00262880E4|nr:LysR family transcriptional regulator [uncultured Shimia sp.]